MLQNKLRRIRPKPIKRNGRTKNLAFFIDNQQKVDERLGIVYLFTQIETIELTLNLNFKKSKIQLVASIRIRDAPIDPNVFGGWPLKSK